MKLEVHIDGSKMGSVEAFHDEVAKKLDFPDYYGKNMDALWDCLTGWIDYDMRLVWDNHKNAQANMGAKFRVAVELFEDLAREKQVFEFVLN